MKWIQDTQIIARRAIFRTPGFIPGARNSGHTHLKRTQTMATVAILSVPKQTGGQSYQAVSAERVATGETAGQALDAFTEQFPEVGLDSLLIVQRFQVDRFFSEAQQQRMAELMTRWREARDAGASLSPEEQAELESLVELESRASGQRAEDVAKGLGK